MAEVLYCKQGLTGPKLELHIAPEGLTLVGRSGRNSTEYAPLADITGVAAKPRGKVSDLMVTFGAQRPAWMLSGLPAANAAWAESVITEERDALAKRGRPEYSAAVPASQLAEMCAAMVASGDSRATVDLVDLILAQGVLYGASDVHFDPFSQAILVRFRLDGVLYDMVRIDPAIKRHLAARLKVVSHLTTFKRSVAQEGRAALKLGTRTVDLRFSSIPTIHGEKVAVRIFDPAKSIFALADLGMTAEMLASLEKMLAAPQGSILLTGPSGSGKTTTLYASLGHLRENRRNLSSIATVEDPVEYDLQVVNQTQVNSASGLTFSSALRTVLRQDPEVIMIGEIRDSETADIAIQAGLTGHLVLSTVHARSAAGVLLRLIDLGVEPYLLASSVSAVLSQRLVRTLCKECAKDYTPTAEERGRFGLKGDDRFAAGAGCDKCSNTGYRGRAGVFQLLPITEAMRDLVLKRCSLSELENQVEQERVKSLFDDGLAKARAGITTLEELTRVLG
jgi:type II secretory ATPase GspE/PulE/Tfp pilus assembly ATPase PilB-like protein